MNRSMGEYSPSNISAHLKGIDFPAERADLCRQAEQNGAEPAVMEALESLDEGPYESMAEVMSAYGDADDAGDQANSEDYDEDNDNADDQQ